MPNESKTETTVITKLQLTIDMYCYQKVYFNNVFVLPCLTGDGARTPCGGGTPFGSASIR